MDKSNFIDNGVTKPIISIVVIFFNMAREAPRTLFTLSSTYQNIDEKYYEVIAIDNGSAQPLGEELVKSFGKNFRYQYIKEAHRSPASALNFGASIARGSLLGFMVDGARMLSPGIIQFAIRAYRSYQNPVISTLSFHLGSKLQAKAIEEGYNQDVEDELLAKIDWQQNGYELFEISVFGGSAKFGWFAPLSESSLVFLTPSHFNNIGGFEEKYDFPGGGFVSIDFYYRATTAKNAELVVILGEGTFHQIHGGAMTGKKFSERRQEMEKLKAQYLAIRDTTYQRAFIRADYVGHLAEATLPSVGLSVDGLSRFKSTYPNNFTKFDNLVKSPNALSSESVVQRCIIILGMHRSGTSMLTGTLRQAGLELGHVNDRAKYNLRGNKENPAIMHLQENLLVANGGSWHDPPHVVQWNRLHLAVRDLFISSFKNRNVWGFKDPRTLFTIDGWLEVLPEAEFVGIFREPSAVVASLQKRNKFTIDQSLNIWKKYNERLLLLHDQHDFPLIEFHSDNSILKTKLKKLVNILKLPARQRKLSFFDNQLRTNQQTGIIVPEEIKSMYRELVKRAI